MLGGKFNNLLLIMKKFFNPGLAAVFALGLTLSIVSCSKDNDEITPSASLKATIVYKTLPKIISGTRSLDADTVYLLDNKTFVTSGGILNIEAGTRIEGIYKSEADSASALIICRGGKINATGSSSSPIVFTAHLDATNTSYTVGDWGGLIILGKAPVNQGSDEEIEGINPPAIEQYGEIDNAFGGSISDDNSGTLSYVRVEYAGASISADNEINSFTFGGVGSGTTLDHLEAYYGADDSFEFFGGTVNAKYLISVSPNDDNFDFDFGYQGKLQFLVGMLDPSAPYSSNGNGIECDNDATGSSSTPLTHPIISNLTMIGTSNGSTSNSTGTVLYGTHFRRNCRFVLRNSVIYGFNTVIYLNGSDVYNNVSETLANSTNTSYSVFADNVIGLIDGASGYNSDWTPGSSNSIVSYSAMGLYYPFYTNYYFYSSIKALAANSTPANSGADFTSLDSDFFTTTTYKGALSSSNYWIAEAWVKTDFPNTAIY